MRRQWVATVCSLCLLLAGTVPAQTAAGRITGTVQDPSRAVLPGVTIVALNQDTGVSYETVSSDSGAYTFEAVPPGRYTITAELPGFKRFTTTNNVITANASTRVQVILEVGEVSEEVRVEASYDKVQTTESGNIGAVVNQKSIVSLPLEGRNPLSLISLQPGVVQGANTGGGTHIFGARDRAINITLDGIDANETSAGNATFTPIRSNPDSLREYRVITSNASAEFGRNSGAQMALVTRSGTNEFHGSLFEFHRNRVLNANDWNLNRQGTERRFLLRNQFGASVGGPIIRDKTHFFFNFQIQRQTETLQQNNTVYTQQARQGIFRYVVGGRNFPVGSATPSVDAQGNPLPGLQIANYNVVGSDPRSMGLDPTVQSILSLTPLPNNFELGDGLNTAGFTFLAQRTDPQRDFNLRFDHVFKETQSLFVRYSWGKEDTVGDTTNSGASRFPGLPPVVNTIREPRNLAVGWRSTLSPKTVNELVVGGNHFLFDFAVGTNSDPRTTPFVLVNVTDPLPNDLGNTRTINTYQIVDNFSHTRSSHTMRFGVNFRLQQHYDIRGSIAGLNGAPSILLGGPVDPSVYSLPPTTEINSVDRTRLQGTINDLLGKVNIARVGLVSQGGSYLPPGNTFSFDAWYPEYDFYFQDDWKFRPNLTFNLGVRWEPRPKPFTRSGSRILVPDQSFVLGAAPSDTLRWVEGDLFGNDFNNLAPSLGAVWDPSGDGKMAISGNYRIAYDRVSTFLPSSAVFPNIPGSTLAVIDTTFGQGGGRIRDGLPALTAPAGLTPSDLAQPVAPSTASQELFDPNFATPMTHMWSFGIQRELAGGFVFQADYIGRAGRNLIGGYERNLAEIFGNGFLDAFQAAKGGGESSLLNQLTMSHPNRRADETGAAFLRRFFASSLTLNNVSSVAASLGQTFLTVGGQLQSLPEANGLGKFFFYPYPQLAGGLQVLDSGSFSNYHGVLFQVQRRFQEGLEFQASYTVSKSLDDRSFDPTFTRISSGTGQTAQQTPFDPENRRLNYGLSDFDRTHVWQANWVYDLPFGRGRRFGADAGPLVHGLLGGWSVTGIFLYETGRPFTVISSTNSFSSRSSSRADFSGSDFGIGEVRDDPQTGVPFLFTAEQRALFSIPAAGEYGNTPRNGFRLPSFFNLDLSIIKRTYFSEDINLEFRAEAFNVTNSVSWGFPSTSANSPATLGRILGTANGARIIQLGLKLNF